MQPRSSFSHVGTRHCPYAEDRHESGKMYESSRHAISGSIFLTAKQTIPHASDRMKAFAACLHAVIHRFKDRFLMLLPLPEDRIAISSASLTACASRSFAFSISLPPVSSPFTTIICFQPYLSFSLQARTDAFHLMTLNVRFQRAAAVLQRPHNAIQTVKAFLDSSSIFAAHRSCPPVLSNILSESFLRKRVLKSLWYMIHATQ